MTLLLAALVLSDVVLAVLVFACLARPELAMGLLAWATGRGAAWRDDSLTPTERAHLAWGRDLARLPLLGLLFLWSFLVGVLMAGLRS